MTFLPRNDGMVVKIRKPQEMLMIQDWWATVSAGLHLGQLTLKLVTHFLKIHRITKNDEYEIS